MSRSRRPLVALLGAMLLLPVISTAPAAAGTSPFRDIGGHPFQSDIVWLWESGITGGCGATTFCPNAAVTREQMASFLTRALHLPKASTDFFSDDERSAHEGSINSLAASGITGGCAAGRFCPRSTVTREQMASFLARAFDLSLGKIDYFNDDDRSPHQTDIHRLAASGITGGCGDSRFCPRSNVTRGQMAAFLHRAIGGASPPAACRLFPASNVWNKRVDALPVAGDSGTLIATIGASTHLHPDYGSFLGYGIPINVVGSSTPRSHVSFDYDDESDPGPYPIPSSPRMEGGSDRHLLLWDLDACRLYELFAARRTASGWHAGSGAIWNLTSNALRPDGWTSADAAGLPILPGLVRFDEVASGAVNHAIRFTGPETRSSHIYPARHHAGAGVSSSLPPMGTRVRLKASFDVSDFSPRVRVILVAMQRYGMILADNGSPWYFTGSADIRWSDDELDQLKSLRGGDFEVVDTTGFVSGG